MSFITLSSVRDFLVRNYAALLLAAFIGCICVAPQIYFAATTPQYAGIVLMGTDAEDHYLARTEEIYEGHFALGNVFLPAKNQPYIQPPLGEIIVAGLGRALDLGVTAAEILSKFIFPFLVTLCVYGLGYLLFNSRRAALIGAMLAMLQDALPMSPHDVLLFLHGSSGLTGFLIYSRPINPEVSGLFLFAALLLLVRGFMGERTPRVWEVVILGLLTGGSLYISPYVFSFLGLFGGILFVRMLLQRKYPQARSLAVAGVIALVSLAPFLVNLYAAESNPAYADTAMRLGFVTSHQPAFSIILFIFLALTLFVWPKRYASTRPFFLIGVISLWLLTNQQVLTGHSLQLSHYHWYISKPLFFMAVGGYIALGIEQLRSGSLRKAASGGVLILTFLAAIFAQTTSYAAITPAATAAQKYAPVLSYLGTVQGEQDVWTDEVLSRYIPIYTQDDVGNSSQVVNYLLPTAYFEEQLFLNYRLRGMLPQDALTTMISERADVSSAIYGLYFREQAGSYAAIPDQVLVSLAQRYAQSFSVSLQRMFSDLGITMIVWDRSADPEWDISALPFTREVYSSGSFTVYRLVR